MIKNRKMADLIKNLSPIKSVNNTINLYDFLMVVNPKIKSINDCLIIDNEDKINVEEVDFSRLMKFFGDKTGYEASSNEIRVNDLVSGQSCEFDNVLQLAINIIDLWSLYLNEKYPSKRFCLTISSDDDFVTIRFHQVRNDEELWLFDDLEKYNEAVGYKIIP